MRVERIGDPADARLDDYRDVRDPELRLSRGQFIAESREVVTALLRSGRFPVRSVLVSESALRALDDELRRLSAPTPVYVADRATIQAVVGFRFHRGCMAVGERVPGPSLEDLLARHPRLLVLCEDLGNPDNVGGVFRNALAFGVDAVVLSPHCCDPLYRQAVRVSIGATLRVPFARVDDWAGTLARLREAGVAVLALTTEGGVDVGDLGTRGLPDRLAIVLGAEGHGLGADSRAAASLQVTIPMAPEVDSLNVATAAAIVLQRIGELRGGGRRRGG